MRSVILSSKIHVPSSRLQTGDPHVKKAAIPSMSIGDSMWLSFYSTVCPSAGEEAEVEILDALHTGCCHMSAGTESSVMCANVSIATGACFVGVWTSTVQVL